MKDEFLDELFESGYRLMLERAENVKTYPDEGKIVATKELEADSKANAFCEVMRQAWTICPDGDVTGKSLTEDGVDS